MGFRWMRIRRIGVDSENTDFHATGTHTSVAEERRPHLSYQQSPSNIVPFARALVIHVLTLAHPRWILYWLLHLSYSRSFQDLSTSCLTTYQLITSKPFQSQFLYIPHQSTTCSASCSSTDRSSNYQVKWCGCKHYFQYLRAVSHSKRIANQLQS